MSAASDHFYALRDRGVATAAAALQAGISGGYGEYLEGLRRRETVGGGEDGTQPKFAHHERCVATLIAAGGYDALSEKLTPGGHIACLPLIKFKAPVEEDAR
jgi:hypothetical protein